MATVPTYRTWVAGEVITAAELNSNVRDAGNFVTGQPLFVGYQATAQAIATATWTAVNLDTEIIDRDGGHSTSSNPSRYTAQTSGYYMVLYTVSFAANTTGVRGARLRVNGTDTAANSVGRQVQSASSTVDSSMSGGGVQYLTAPSDYIEVVCYQTTGANLNTGTGVDTACRMQVFWIST